MSETKTEVLDSIACDLRCETINQPMSPVEAALVVAVARLIEFIRDEVKEP